MDYWRERPTRAVTARSRRHSRSRTDARKLELAKGSQAEQRPTGLTYGTPRCSLKKTGRYGSVNSTSVRYRWLQAPQPPSPNRTGRLVRTQLDHPHNLGPPARPAGHPRPDARPPARSARAGAPGLRRAAPGRRALRAGARPWPGRPGGGSVPPHRRRVGQASDTCGLMCPPADRSEYELRLLSTWSSGGTWSSSRATPRQPRRGDQVWRPHHPAVPPELTLPSTLAEGPPPLFAVDCTRSGPDRQRQPPAEPVRAADAQQMNMVPDRAAHPAGLRSSQSQQERNTKRTAIR